MKRRTPRDPGKFAVWLQGAMDRAGMKQAQLADRVGVRPQAVSAWLQGGPVSEGNLKKLAEIFGQPEGEVVGRYLLGERAATIKAMVRDAVGPYAAGETVFELTVQEAKLLRVFRDMPERRRKAWLDLLDGGSA